MERPNTIEADKLPETIRIRQGKYFRITNNETHEDFDCDSFLEAYEHYGLDKSVRLGHIVD